MIKRIASDLLGRDPADPFDRLPRDPLPPRTMKKLIFTIHNLTLLHTAYHNIDQSIYKMQSRKITIPNNNIVNRPPPEIDKTETELPTQT